MTAPGTGTPGGGGVHGSTFNGPSAFQTGDHATQYVQFVYRWKPAYRIEGFPATPRPVPARMTAEQPSRLLRAVHQVVPFTGRGRDLDALARWRDDPTPGAAVRLVHGPGGQGKTRLASRFAELSREAGWTVWQAAVNETDAEAIDTSPAPDTAAGLLLVVDYAERWPAPDLHRLLQEPLLHRAGAPVRILLLARPAGIWWESLDTWIGDTLDAPAESHLLLPVADDPQARAALFRQARDRFADHLGLPPGQAARIGPPLDLDTDDDYAQILTLHIAALAAVDAHLHDESAPTDPARASAYLLKRERAHWSALHQRRPQPLSTTPEAMGRTVLTATLTRPLARAHGRSALDRIGLADSTAEANTLLDDHRYCYPPPHADPARTVTVLEPLYPDRLGEDFLGLTTPAGPDARDTAHPVPRAVTDDWAHHATARLLLDPNGAGTAAPWTRDTLTVLIETARRWPHVATGELYPLLKNHPELALHAGGTALAALAGLDSLDLTVLEAIEPHFPEDRHIDLDVGIAAVTARLAYHRLATTHDPATRARTHATLAARQSYAGLRGEALTAGENAVCAWRDLCRTNPAHQPGLALSLSNLGAFLAAVGRWEEALAAAQEAVEICRQLASGNPAAHASDLARSLSNLGEALSAVGRREEALIAGEEAVEIYRLPASANPAAHASDLARSLSNLGNRLSAVGRWGEALTAGEEAVEIYRLLASGNPAAYSPELAGSLTNLGTWLSAVGRREEALTGAEEAVEIHRRLVSGNPAAYTPDLAGSLSNVAIRLSAVGRRREALTAGEEAVDIYRRLASDNSAAYEPDLARSLSNLGEDLAEVGRRQEALAAGEEAVQIYRRLASVSPAAYEPDLARSLSNFGIRLSGVGRREEALIAAEEAVDIYRRLASVSPAAYEPDFARSLSNLGAWLSGVGRREEALTAAEEAVEINQRLASANPAAHEPDLAASLSNLGIRLSGVGRREEALAAEQKAAAIRRRLAADNPAAHEPDLARSLSNLGAFLSGMGRRTEALTAGEEAVKIRRRLAADSPAAYEPDLARSLSNLGAWLSAVGRRDEALTAGEEAVAICRRLAAANPAAYEPDLARSLSNLGEDLSAVGRRSEALTASQEAVQLYRRLVSANPAAHEPDLAASLTNWACVRHEARQDPSGALRATGEAVEIYRRLMTSAPARFLSPLRFVLGLQADLLVRLGRVREAREIRTWLAANTPGVGRSTE
ncbi:tetratricopeptide repeat protein [Streptomyces asoensis]|uniref:tetratricopeptide repeat protein n=1 Tax=Streptomyces asoensis TaxID=249586 RepID=UPI0037A53B46